MKDIILLILVLILVGLWIAMIFFVIFKVAHTTTNIHDTSSERLLYQCQEYEIQGILPKGSCSCSQKLFPKFSESYDWIDACEILKAKNGGE